MCAAFTSQQCLTVFRRSLLRFVTFDESRIHWYTPETTDQWTSPGESTEKGKYCLTAGKEITIVFCNSQGVIYIWISKGKTVTRLSTTPAHNSIVATNKLIKSDCNHIHVLLIWRLLFVCFEKLLAGQKEMRKLLPPKSCTG